MLEIEKQTLSGLRRCTAHGGGTDYFSILTSEYMFDFSARLSGEPFKVASKKERR
jgi:hypothetical protein